MNFSCLCTEPGNAGSEVVVGDECVAPREASDVGGGDDGGVEPGVEPEERKRLRWTSPRKTLPMFAIREAFEVSSARPLRVSEL